MAKARYQYGTSPRKITPEVSRKQKVEKKPKLRVVKDMPRQEVKVPTTINNVSNFRICCLISHWIQKLPNKR